MVYQFVKQVNLRQLHKNLSALSFYVALNTVGTDIAVTTTHTLDAGEYAQLEGVINATTNTPAPAPVILEIAADATEDFRSLDYKIGLTQSLYPQRTFVQGELRAVDWYLEPAFTTKVLSVSVVYSRDALQFVQYRTTTRTWYNTDGSANPLTKITVKIYDAVSSQGESKKRRENNILAMQSSVISYMVQTIGGNPMDSIALGKAFMYSLDTPINLYIKSASGALAAAVAADTTTSWLNNVVPGDTITIRDFILQELS